MKVIATRTCNREGCERPVYARAKCRSHFNSMIKSLRRQGSTLFAMVESWPLIVAAMPGTYSQLADRTGLAYGTIQKTMTKRYKAGDIHIASHIAPPPKDGGGRWVAVYGNGPGEDHVVSAKRKRAYMLRRKRELHAARRIAEKAPAAISTRWNLAFFNPAEVRA